MSARHVMTVFAVALLLAGLISPVGAFKWLNLTPHSMGMVYNYSAFNVSFSTIVASAGTEEIDDVFVTRIATGSMVMNFTGINRTIVIFDTSSIPDDATITDAIVCVNATGGAANVNGGSVIYMPFYNGTVSDVNNIQASDFQGASTFTLTHYGSPMYYTGNFARWHEHPFFSVARGDDPEDSGLWYINKTGFTVLFSRIVEDAFGTYYPPFWVATNESYVTADSVTLNISYIDPDEPVADFSADRTGSVGPEPQVVSFVDLSTNSPTSWLWTMISVDNTTVFSTDQNPVQTFYYGNWSIVLAATNAAGTNISVNKTWVNVSLPAVPTVPTTTYPSATPTAVTVTPTPTLPPISSIPTFNSSIYLNPYVLTGIQQYFVAETTDSEAFVLFSNATGIYLSSEASGTTTWSNPQPVLAADVAAQNLMIISYSINKGDSNTASFDFINGTSSRARWIYTSSYPYTIWTGAPGQLISSGTQFVIPNYPEQVYFPTADWSHYPTHSYWWDTHWKYRQLIYVGNAKTVDGVQAGVVFSLSSLPGANSSYEDVRFTTFGPVTQQPLTYGRVLSKQCEHFSGICWYTDKVVSCPLGPGTCVDYNLSAITLYSPQSAQFWVVLPAFNESNPDPFIYAYWGNPDAQDEGNIQNVFDFYETFDNMTHWSGVQGPGDDFWNTSGYTVSTIPYNGSFYGWYRGGHVLTIARPFFDVTCYGSDAAWYWGCSNAQITSKKAFSAPVVLEGVMVHEKGGSPGANFFGFVGDDPEDASLVYHEDPVAECTYWDGLHCLSRDPRVSKVVLASNISGNYTKGSPTANISTGDDSFQYVFLPWSSSETGWWYAPWLGDPVEKPAYSTYYHSSLSGASPASQMHVTFGVGPHADGGDSGWGPIWWWMWVRKWYPPSPVLLPVQLYETINPTAQWGANVWYPPYMVVPNEDIQFLDASAGYGLDQWFWDFGDGTVLNFTSERNPSHHYDAVGNYSIKFCVHGTGGVDCLNRTNFVRVVDTPTLVWDAAPRYAFINLTANQTSASVLFTDNTTIVEEPSPTSPWQYWFYGDATGDFTHNKTTNHTYYAGTYSPMHITIPTNIRVMIGEMRNAYILINSVGGGGVGFRYGAHHVKIFARNSLGVPLEGVLVNATFLESSGPLEWLYAWLGLAPSAAPMVETLSGHTGTDGAIDFMMFESLKYHITADKADTISAAMDIYPKDDTYTIFSSPFGGSGQWYEHGYNELEIIGFSAENAEINSTMGLVNVSYTDALGGTSQADVWVNKTTAGNSTEEFVTSFVHGAGNFTTGLYVPNQRGHSYMVRLNATHSTFGTVYRSGSFAFDSGPINIGPIPESWHLPIALIVLLFTAMLIPLTGANVGLMFLCFEGWVFFGMGWLRDFASPVITGTALVLMTVLVVAFMFIEKKNEVG